MRQVFLKGQHQRDFAKSLIDASTDKDVMNIVATSRTLEQNNLMWRLIADIRRSPNNERPHWQSEAWKCGLMHSLGHEIQWDKGLGNCGPLPIGFRSSHLNVKEMAALITHIYAYGAENGVVFKEQRCDEK